MKEIHKTEIAVIGAGLTGLTLAYYLRKAGKNVTLIEQAGKPGGVISTCNEGEFVFETGPNTGILANPEIVELFEDLRDRCIIEKAAKESKSRWIWKDGKWNSLPSGLKDAIDTPLFTLHDKIRILSEPFRKRGSDPLESVADLVNRRLGTSYLNYAVDPFISGIYAGDPAQLITRYALPKLYQLEQQYGSFIGGAVIKNLQKKDDRQIKATREVFSVRNGMVNLIHALTKAIGEENIITGSGVVSIMPFENGFKTKIQRNQNSLSSEKVITTTGAYTLPSLLQFVSADRLQPITSLRYAAIVQVAVGYSKWQGIAANAFGGLMPSKERRNILGILFPSSIFKRRAPEKGMLFSVFLGGIRNPGVIEISDEGIRKIVLDEIHDTMGIKDSQPDLLKIFRYNKAIPQYEMSSSARLACIEELQNLYPGLILAGNIRDGIGIADRVRQAKKIAIALTK